MKISVSVVYSWAFEQLISCISSLLNGYIILTAMKTSLKTVFQNPSLCILLSVLKILTVVWPLASGYCGLTSGYYCCWTQVQVLLINGYLNDSLTIKIVGKITDIFFRFAAHSAMNRKLLTKVQERTKMCSYLETKAECPKFTTCLVMRKFSKQQRQYFHS